MDNEYWLMDNDDILIMVMVVVGCELMIEHFWTMTLENST